MAAPIALPLFTGDRTNRLVVLPNPPSAPPLDTDVTTAVRLSQDLIQVHKEDREGVPAGDVVRGIKYTVNTIIAHGGLLVQPVDVGDQPPAWFMPTLTTALEPLNQKIREVENTITTAFTDLEKKMTNSITDLTRRLVKVERMSAKTYNGTRSIGDDVVYEIVPFPDGTYPSDHNLPPLVSPQAVLSLTESQLEKYFRRYNELPFNAPVAQSANELRRFMFHIIGAHAGVERL